MSNSEALRKQRLGKVINKLSKVQDKILQQIVGYVKEELEYEFPKFKFSVYNDWYIRNVVADLKKNFPDIDFYYENKNSSMRPDGGVLTLQGHDDALYPILISERKSQGTNDKRKEEGKSKQSLGNAIERLGKNVIGFRTALLKESIFPFVCFGDGCDFVPNSPILDRVGVIAMFANLNKVNLHTEQGIFNRGSFYFREKEWDNKEMFDVCLEIATRSVHYYMSKYKKAHFNQ